ncbi:MAG: DUF2461 family protein [Bacteroidetes bacterium]|nr:DUF2461 family protein [Bacteroidota bacterium]
MADSFGGFNKELFRFLKDLDKNNYVAWFHKNYDRYQNYLVQPAKSFITEIAPFLNRLNPAIRTEPKFNQTIMRLNKDMRFAKGDPYRAFLLIHFGRIKLDSEFYIYFEPASPAGSPKSFSMGIFINRSEEEKLYFRQNQVKFKKEIIEVCKKYKISNNYSLSYLWEENEEVVSKFNAEKHFDLLAKHDLLLLEKIKNPSEKILYSDGIVIEMIKMISQLYPLYCFAISPQPLKELQKFEDNFGEVV